MSVNSISPSFLLPQEDPDHEPGSVRVLATVFKNAKECSRKIYTVHTLEQLITQTTSEQLGFAFDRVLKYHTDFQEFVDVDRNTAIKNFDRFQVFMSSTEALSQTNAGEAHQIQVFVFIVHVNIFQVSF